MKKVLVLNYEFPPLGGGGGVAAKKLAESWTELGYHVDYITTWVHGMQREEKIDGISVYRCPVFGKREQNSAGFLSLISFPVCAYKMANKLCKENNYEFINTHFAVPTGPLGVCIGRKYNIKNILSVHGGDIYDPTKKFSPHKWWVFRICVSWVLNKSNYVVAQSNNTKENTIKYYKIDGEKINIVPLPYETIKFNKVKKSELGMENNRKYLISVGRMVRRKGYDFLLDILDKIPEVGLVIVGEGPERKNLEEKIEKLKLNNRVILTGNISDEKKFQYLSNADIYVLSSVHEGFGIVLQEAMQVGLPIVSTNYGGQVDLINDGENGYLIKYGDVKKAKDSICKILNDDELYQKMRTNNLNKVKEYKSSNVAQQYLNLLNNDKDAQKRN